MGAIKNVNFDKIRAAKRSKMYANRDFSSVLLAKAATRPNCIAFWYHGGYESPFGYKNHQKVTKKHPKHRGQGAGEHQKNMGNHDFVTGIACQSWYKTKLYSILVPWGL